ncbi:hypothetical protein LFX25_20555 [Leptospira sp. FAT2]|uniref:hypothetical protein n=1 Tax=Leptospira sanjuanensis TaxID=2879643 RepID=UPI001EE919A6|nr:hypothetical protein [Leptospira sanjuanensis]MCG6195638.1 hypothetical protein [Leptospira sanjuanensis]
MKKKLNPPPKKKTKGRGGKTPVSKKGYDVLSEETKEEIRLLFLRGTSREEICKRFKLTYKKLDNLIQGNGWNLDRKEFSGNLRRELEGKIVTDLAQTLERIKEESVIFLDFLKNRILYEEASNSDLLSLFKSRNTVLKELFRSLGEPDTIRQDSGNSEEKSQVNIQVVLGVGERPGAVEKLLGGNRVVVEEISSKNRSEEN